MTGPDIAFIPFDPENWPRREIFRYFGSMAPTGWSLTRSLDVTRLRQALKDTGYRFFPAYLWLVTKAVCEQPELRTAVKDGVPGAYSTLTPLYAHFHEDDGTFSLMWTPYVPDFRVFHEMYLENREKYGNNHGFLAQKGMLPPENAYTVSCLPWESFSHFAVHSYDSKPYYFPSVEAGRFEEREGRLLMPLSVTCHHAATDGLHVHRFLETLQHGMNEPESFL